VSRLFHVAVIGKCASALQEIVHGLTSKLERKERDIGKTSGFITEKVLTVRGKLNLPPCKSSKVRNAMPDSESRLLSTGWL
jgi:hypothetical protein